LRIGDQGSREIKTNNVFNILSGDGASVAKAKEAKDHRPYRANDFQFRGSDSDAGPASLQNDQDSVGPQTLGPSRYF
jgi:hypothetical protein